MKVALVNTHGIAGGAARSCYGLLTGLRTLGHDAQLLVLNRLGSFESVVAHDKCPGRAESDLFTARLRQYGLSVGARGRWFSPDAPYSGLAKHPLVAQADIINLHWVADFVSVRDLAELFSLGKPVVWTLHDERPMTGGCHYTGSCRQFGSTCAQCPQLQPQLWDMARCTRQAENMVLEAAKNLTVVGPSHWIARQAKSSSAFSKKRIEIIPYDVDVEMFRPPDGMDEKKKIRKLLRIDEEALVFMVGGASLSDDRKGLHVFEKAAKIMLRHQPAASSAGRNKVVFCSFGAAPRASSSFARSPVRYLGKAHDEEGVAQYLRACDVFVCPSLEDNLPNSVIEAMACGCAVIATRTGGLPDLIDVPCTGLLTEPGNPLSLAEAMNQIVRSEQSSLDSMRQNALSKCLTFFARPTQAEAYEGLFHDLLKAEGTVAHRFTDQHGRHSFRELSSAMRSAESWLSSFYPRGLSARFLFARAKANRGGGL